MKADELQDLQSRFTELANEEEQIERAEPKDRLLRAYCTYEKNPEVCEKGKPGLGFMKLETAPECGVWMLSDGVSENFQARFRALVARAGVALGCPKGTEPEDFWLHRLYLDLRESNSQLLLCERSQPTNTILRVCEASATFCSRLEKEAVASAGGSFAHSQDYRSVTVRGKTYTLTARQAQIIEILHEARANGNADVSTARILEALETPNSRWQDTFKSNPDARKALVAFGKRKGTLRLNL